MKCERSQHQFKCSECKKTKVPDEFPEDVALNPASYCPGKKKLLCTSCRTIGKTPRRTTREFACSGCKETKVADEFPEDVARNPARYGPGSKGQLICTSCRERADVQ